MSQAERSVVSRTLEGDERAFRQLYDTAFRVAFTFAARSAGERRLAEAATARALRRTFAALPALREQGAPSLGTFVLRFAEQALRDLRAERAAAEAPAAPIGAGK